MLKLEDFILQGYEHHHFNGSWLSRDEILYKEANSSICVYNVRSKHKEMLLDGAMTVRDLEEKRGRAWGVFLILEPKTNR